MAVEIFQPGTIIKEKRINQSHQHHLGINPLLTMSVCAKFNGNLLIVADQRGRERPAESETFISPKARLLICKVIYRFTSWVQTLVFLFHIEGD